MVDKCNDMKGFLKKLKSSSFAKLFGNTNTRWFELRFKDKVFMYKEKSSSEKVKGSHALNEITDFAEKVSVDERKQCDWMFGFVVTLRGKKFILFTETQTEYHGWVNAFEVLLNRKKVIEPVKRGNSVLVSPNEVDTSGAISKRHTMTSSNVKKDINVVSNGQGMKKEENKGKVVNDVTSTITGGKKSAEIKPHVEKKQEIANKTTKVVKEESQGLSESEKIMQRRTEEKLKKENEEKENQRIFEEKSKLENEEKIRKLKEKLKQKRTVKRVDTPEDQEDDLIINGLNTEKDEHNNKHAAVQAKETKTEEKKINVKEDIEDWNYYDNNNKITDLENGIGKIIKNSAQDLNRSMQNPELNSSIIKGNIDPNVYRNSLMLENLNLQNHSMHENNSIERDITNNNNSIFFENSVNSEEFVEKKEKVQKMNKNQLKADILNDKNEKLNMMKKKPDKSKSVVAKINFQPEISQDEDFIVISADTAPFTKQTNFADSYNKTNPSMFNEVPVKPQTNTIKMQHFNEVSVPFNNSISQSNAITTNFNDAPVPYNKTNSNLNSKESFCEEAQMPFPSKVLETEENILCQRETVPLKKEQPVPKSNPFKNNNINDFEFDFGVEKQVPVKNILGKKQPQPTKAISNPSPNPNINVAPVTKSKSTLNEVVITLGGKKKDSVKESPVTSIKDNSSSNIQGGNSDMINALIKKTLKKESMMQNETLMSNSNNELPIEPRKGYFDEKKDEDDNFGDSNRFIVEDKHSPLTDSFEHKKSVGRNEPAVVEVAGKVSVGKKKSGVFEDDFDDFSVFPVEYPNEGEKKFNTELKEISHTKNVTVFEKKEEKKAVQNVNIPQPIHNSYNLLNSENIEAKYIEKKPEVVVKEDNAIIINNYKNQVEKPAQIVLPSEHKKVIKEEKKEEKRDIFKKIEKIIDKNAQTGKKSLWDYEDDEDEFEKILKKKTTTNKFGKDKLQSKGNKYIKAKCADYFDDKTNHSFNGYHNNINDLSFNDSSNIVINNSFNNFNKENSFCQNDNSFRSPNDNSLFGRENFLGEEMENNSIENSFGNKEINIINNSKIHENEEEVEENRHKMSDLKQNTIDNNKPKIPASKPFGFNESFENNDEW